MATYTASDFCQGHGGGRDCVYDLDSDQCDHGQDFNHGVTSYCDGTCPEARESYGRYLQLELRIVPQASSTEAWLAVSGQGVSYEVCFEGASAEDRALVYMSARKGLHFDAVEDRPFSGAHFARLYDALYPQCHHGLGLDLCMDPYGDNHFGTREQELAAGW